MVQALMAPTTLLVLLPAPRQILLAIPSVTSSVEKLPVVFPTLLNPKCLSLCRISRFVERAGMKVVPLRRFREMRRKKRRRPPEARKKLLKMTMSRWRTPLRSSLLRHIKETGYAAVSLEAQLVNYHLGDLREWWCCCICYISREKDNISDDSQCCRGQSHQICQSMNYLFRNYFCIRTFDDIPNSFSHSAAQRRTSPHPNHNEYRTS